MIYLGKFCCVCLYPGKKLEKLFIQQNFISYYYKLSILFPEMNINEIKKITFICNDCKRCVDKMFDFRTKCLRNNNRLRNYILRLRSNKNERIISELFINKQEIEVLSDDLGGYESIGRADRNLQFDDYVIYNKGIRVEEHIKKEILDDERPDVYKKNQPRINSETATVDSDSTSETYENIPLDIRYIINGVMDYQVKGYDVKNINPLNQGNDLIDETVINDTKNYIKNDMEFTNSDIYRNCEVKSDVMSLHTEIDLDSCIKNEISYECVMDKSEVPENDTNLKLDYIVKKSVSDTCDTTDNPNRSIEHSKDENKINDVSEEDFLNENNKTHLIGDKKRRKHKISYKSFQDSQHISQVRKSFKCDICNKTMSAKYKLKEHKRIHTNEKPYKCEVCNKTFRIRNSLRVHKSVHSSEKPYKCEICKKAFKIILNLKRHNLVHSNETPYKCEKCDKQFKRAHDLKRHKKIHTERKYSCKICNKSFIHLNTFNIHYKLHTHKIFHNKKYHNSRLHTDNEGYKCKLCNKVFDQLHLLEIHAGTHRIDQNHKIFDDTIKIFLDNTITESDLSNGIHSAEKTSECKISKEMSPTKSTVNIQNINTYIVNKHFKCEICNKSFIRLKALNEHSKIHSDETPVCNTTVQAEYNIKIIRVPRESSK